MRDKFRGYYRPADEEFEEMWRNGIFVLDTNVLLNLYRYSDSTRDQLLQILRAIKERIWLPHQVAQEYMRDRLSEIHNQNKRLQDLRDFLRTTLENVERELSSLHRDPGIEAKELMEEVRGSFDKLLNYAEELENRSMGQSNSPEDDKIWGAIDEIIADRIGEPYPSDRQQEILQEGNKRYAAKLPPGYKDASKNGTAQFGDLILWFQTIDKAKETGKPIIFVTADRKEDWWWISHGRTIGPRPELADEIYREAHVSFYIYTPERFMEYAKTYLHQEVSDEAIGEVQELGEREEAEVTIRELRERLGAATETLTDDEKQVIDLHYYEGLSRQEIAERLGLSSQRVAQILREALSKLREEIDTEVEEVRQEESKTRTVGASSAGVSPGVMDALPAIAAANRIAKARRHVPQTGLSEEQMRILGEAAKHLPSERDMRTIREAAKHMEQLRKYLGQ